MTHVIVNRLVVFNQVYKNEIDKFYDEYQTWITDNFGYEARYEYSYTMIEGKIYFVFDFETDEDATAFKLRWI